MIKFGNHKLGDDTAIFNMGTAMECPSRKLGLCYAVNNSIKCYAEKPEQQYPNTVPAARKRQEILWKSKSGRELLEEFKQKIARRRKDTRFLRYNESGDFYNQQDITKLSYIAEGLKTIGIVTYGYTARSDLDFRGVEFLVKGSGHDKGNNGSAIILRSGEQPPKGYLLCPGSCKRCNLCKIDVPHNIAFRKH